MTGDDMPDRRAILFFTPEWNGMHPGAWRLRSSDADGAMDFAVVSRLVRAAEAAKFHGFFLADPLGFRLHISPAALARTATAVRYEPFTLMAALSQCTEHIGLLMTAQTSYDEPYHVARRFASLDHLSKGRAGWNVVTAGDPSGSVLFGRPRHLGHSERYRRGAEFVEAVTALWDTWDDDAFEMDKESGRYFDTSKLHIATKTGEYVHAAGPLNVPRPVQGYPVLAQAGSSPSGRDFAARYAEVIFTLQPDIDHARDFGTKVRQAATRHGRDGAHLKILPSLTLVVAESDAAADARFAELDALVDDRLGLELLGGFLDADLSGCHPDDPVPDVAETAGSQTVQGFFLAKARRDNLTIRELIGFMLRWGAIGGSPTTIADHIEEWIRAGACDGFNVTFADLPDSMNLFVAEVIPELQRRNIFHHDYEGATLRDNLGLPRPVNQFQAVRR
ncbi:NtaA/DmoA family FMN-dependent monooxygenase [Nocardia suismassiliense]|uniref:NtaA/DmoA family FMN-dependent monooxygenase n=1 Tax=Nocardia suismassiliense TaxID=2077092 RepID=UPI00131EF884|nr:NtaA/DmoA family FMN-dependent monooxygenase [Nocardia suismassiliense]